MSALGQKQTFRDVRLVSALPPIAGMVQRDHDVRFVPKGTFTALLDHLVGAGEQCGRNCKAQNLRGREIEDKIEFGRLFDRDVARLACSVDCLFGRFYCWSKFLYAFRDNLRYLHHLLT